MRKADKADALSNVANRTQGHFKLCSFPARICYIPLLYHSVNFLRGKRKKPLKLKVQVFIKMWLWSKNCVKNKIGGLKTSTPLMLSPALSLLLQFLSKRSRAEPLGGWAGVASLLCVRQKMGQTHCMVPWGCLLLDKTLALFHVSWVYCGYIYLVAFHSQRDSSAIQACIIHMQYLAGLSASFDHISSAAHSEHEWWKDKHCT